MIALTTLLAIGATIAVSELVNDEPASIAQRVTPATNVTVPAEVCTPETDNLLASATALPPAVVNNLSPDLRDFIEASVLFGQSPRYLPAADTMTIGRVLAQLHRVDYLRGKKSRSPCGSSTPSRSRRHSRTSRSRCRPVMCEHARRSFTMQNERTRSGTA